MKKKLDGKWLAAAAGFLMVFTVLGFCSSSKSLYTAAVSVGMQIIISAASREKRRIG